MLKALLNLFRSSPADKPQHFNSRRGGISHASELLPVVEEESPESPAAALDESPATEEPANAAESATATESATETETAAASETEPQSLPENLEEAVIKALRGVFDPEIPVNIYDLGLIYDIIIDEPIAPSIKMTLTSPNCPEAEAIPQRVQEAVKSVPGVESCDVEIVWEPAWTPEKMSEGAKLELGMF